MSVAMLAVLLSLLLPLFLVTGLGYALARTAWLRPGWQSALADVTARILIPVLLFSGAFRTGIPAFVNWQFVLAFFGPLTGLFALVYWSRRGEGRAPCALAATYSNTVFVGIPLLTEALGPDSVHVAFPLIAIHGLVAFTLYYLAAPSGKARHILGALRSTVSNPIVVSLMLGLAANQLGRPAALAPAAAMMRALDLLAAAALPCALLSLGAALAGMRAGGWATTAVIVGVKLVALPAGVLGMAILLALPREAAAVLVLLAACPVGVNGAAVVQGDGADPAPVSAGILFSTLLCMLTLPCWIYIVKTTL